MTLDREYIADLSARDLDALLLHAGAELTIATRPASTKRYRAVLVSSGGAVCDGFGETMLQAVIDAVLAAELSGELDAMERAS